MADELSISHLAYRKIENNQSKLTVERLLQIANIFDIPIMDLLDENQSRIYNQSNSGTGTLIGHQEFENYYQENKEFVQNHVKDLKDEIIYLRTEIDFLRGLLEKQ